MNEDIRSALLRVLPFAVILIILLIRLQQKKIEPRDLYLNKPLSIQRFFIWTLGFLSLVLLTEFCFFQLGILEIDKWHHSLYPSIIRIFGAVILAPIVEELIFRGLILNVLIKRELNIHFAIFIQACLFVMLHSFTWQNDLSSNIAVVQGMVDATLFAYARYYTRSIYTSMTMHMTGNLVATLERFIF